MLPPAPILDLVTLVPTLASVGHGSSSWPTGCAHLDLVIGGASCAIAVDSFLANLELMTLMLTGPHPDLVTLVLTCGPL